MKDHPLLIGLTGSIGAGKSTVAAIIAEAHPVLDSDRIARELMEQDDAVRSAITEAFGVQAYLSDGSLNRGFLAEIVFDDAQKLEILNDIVHPPVIDRIHDEAERLYGKGERVVFVESALIFEAGIQEHFDYVIAVISNADIAARRIRKRDDLSEEAVRKRMRNQLPPEEKSGRADFTIRNNGSLDELQRATRAVLSIVTKLSPKHRA